MIDASLTDNDTEQNQTSDMMHTDTTNAKELKEKADRLRRGDGVPMNKLEALRTYKKAADQGNGDALVEYAIMLQNGEGVKPNEKKAKNCFELAASLGNAKGIAKHASYVEDNNTKISLYYKSIELGYTGAYYDLGFYFDFIKENYKLASQYYIRGFEVGDYNCMDRYASLIINYHVPGVEPAKANEYYKIAADYGVSLAMVHYANNLLEGKYIKKNKKEAIRYLKMAGDSGQVI